MELSSVFIFSPLVGSCSAELEIHFTRIDTLWPLCTLELARAKAQYNFYSYNYRHVVQLYILNYSHSYKIPTRIQSITAVDRVRGLPFMTNYHNNNILFLTSFRKSHFP